MGACGIRAHRQQHDRQKPQQRAHRIPLRKATPASAIAPPAARTASRPAGQRAQQTEADAGEVQQSGRHHEAD